MQMLLQISAILYCRGHNNEKVCICLAYMQTFSQIFLIYGWLKSQVQKADHNNKTPTLTEDVIQEPFEGKEVNNSVSVYLAIEANYLKAKSFYKTVFLAVFLNLFHTPYLLNQLSKHNATFSMTHCIHPFVAALALTAILWEVPDCTGLLLSLKPVLPFGDQGLSGFIFVFFSSHFQITSYYPLTRI